MKMPEADNHNLALLKAMSSLTHIISKQDFIAWTRDELQLAFPHGAFIAGVGKIDSLGAVPFELVSSNFPDEYLNAIRVGNRHYKTPTMQRWLKTGQPQLFEPEINGAGIDTQWLRIFKASGLRNIAAYGICDIAGQYASYFSFHQIPGPLGEWHQLQLKIIVPNMHSALLNIMRRDKVVLDDLTYRSLITPREREVLVWICEGKTSEEIASILGVSCKTIAHHAQSVLEKLEVRNRAQAVAMAYRLKLVRSSPR